MVAAQIPDYEIDPGDRDKPSDPSEYIEIVLEPSAERIADLPVTITAFEHNARRRSISLSSILPTQDYVTCKGLAGYMRQKRHVTKNGDAPYGLRFKGSRVVYLVDGHHRWYACKQKGRKRMWLVVDDIDQPLDVLFADMDRGDYSFAGQLTFVDIPGLVPA